MELAPGPEAHFEPILQINGRIWVEDFNLSPRGHRWALISLLRDTEYGERDPSWERAKGGEWGSELTAGPRLPPPLQSSKLLLEYLLFNTYLYNLIF